MINLVFFIHVYGSVYDNWPFILHPWLRISNLLCWNKF